MFLSEFFGITEGAKEVAVCCPFDHYTTGLVPYKETRPSAHVNTEKGVFHCKACGTGYSELQFMQKILDCSFLNAKRLQHCFDNDEDELMWNNSTRLSEETKARAMNLGISEAIISELNIKTPTGTTDVMAFPVFMYGHLIDVRNYNPGGTPKIKSRANCPSGIVLPFDLWRNTPKNRTTIVCAGEKDMAIARTMGFNAITLTGGEQAPCITPAEFKDRKVVICYDNDDAGHQGALKLALQLYEYTKDIKIITNFHEVCCEKGEDITDFFIKYGKTKRDLIGYIEATPVFVPTEEMLNKQYPIISLLEASKPENVGKMVRSNIQVVAVADSTFTIPSVIFAEKIKLTGQNDNMFVGECREWELSEDNCQDTLHLMDNNFKEETINKNIRDILKIMQTERCVSIKKLTKRTVFKVSVTDLFETNDVDISPMEYTAYSLDQKLESGKKYLATYKLVPHPYKGQQLTMVITEVVQANDSVTNFQLTSETKENLKKYSDALKNFQTVTDKVQRLTNCVKGLLGYNGNDTLIQALDLAYNTPLQFNFGTFKNVRGYLDTLIIGESRVGKSSTADTLRKTYGLGIFTSLAGNSATIPGLVGGSNKTAGGYQTRAGIIPQNHKGLIIFEEFGKSNANVLKELTDIRSSNEVRVTRVSGTLTLPATVRMIALTNVKAHNGSIRPIAAYPHGFSILTELVDTAEDIARYDLIVILSDKGASQIDPFWEPDQPLEQDVYKTHIRWVWSRQPEDIIIDREVGLYIMEQSNELNKTYPCHIKLFGTECWKKVSRLAIAVAAYVMSTDDTQSKVIVTKEHVDYAIAFYKRIYDNETFKLKEYVEHERRYSEIDEAGVAKLQDLYNKFTNMILHLEQSSTTSKNTLGAATGLSNDDLNKALNILSKCLFITFENHEIVPTERFRLGLNQINRDTVIRGVGE
jgi:DNA primase